MCSSGGCTAFFRATVPGLAGMAGMSYKRSLIANATGGIIWAVGFTLLGYFVGSAYKRLESVSGIASSVLLGVVVVCLIGLRVRAGFATNGSNARRGRTRPSRRPTARAAASTPRRCDRGADDRHGAQAGKASGRTSPWPTCWRSWPRWVASVTSVLQRIGIESAPAEASLRLSMIAHVVRRRIWLLGIRPHARAVRPAGFGAAVRAIDVVQPVLTVELLFLVAGLTLFFGYRLRWRDWVGSMAVVGGLAGSLLVARPAEVGLADPDGMDRGQRRRRRGRGGAASSPRDGGAGWWRAAAFGASAALFAYNAALVKATTTLVTRGWGHVFVSWEPYGIAVTGVVGLFLLQNALHAGPITASRAANQIVGPIASVLIGVAVFDEQLGGGVRARWRERGAGGAVRRRLPPHPVAARGRRTLKGDAGEFLGHRHAPKAPAEAAPSAVRSTGP